MWTRSNFKFACFPQGTKKKNPKPWVFVFIGKTCTRSNFKFACFPEVTKEYLLNPRGGFWCPSDPKILSLGFFSAHPVFLHKKKTNLRGDPKKAPKKVEKNQCLGFVEIKKGFFLPFSHLNFRLVFVFVYFSFFGRSNVFDCFFCL